MGQLPNIPYFFSHTREISALRRQSIPCLLKVTCKWVSLSISKLPNIPPLLLPNQRNFNSEKTIHSLPVKGYLLMGQSFNKSASKYPPTPSPKSEKF
jgi:hypothetical protein